MGTPEVAAVILAAGASRRFKGIKALAKFSGETLLQRIIKQAKISQTTHEIIVLGAYVDQLRAQITDESIHCIFNENWHQGMSQSIIVALKYINHELPTSQGVLFLTLDQWSVDYQHINALIDHFGQTNKPVASAYQGTLGIPALFPKKDFKRLMRLKGDKGAKELLYKADAIDLRSGGDDVDDVLALGRIEG